MNSRSVIALAFLWLITGAGRGAAQNVLNDTQRFLVKEWGSTAGAKACLKALYFYAMSPPNKTEGLKALTDAADDDAVAMYKESQTPAVKRPIDLGAEIAKATATSNRLVDLTGAPVATPALMFGASQSFISTLYAKNVTRPVLSTALNDYDQGKYLLAMYDLLNGLPSKDPAWLQQMQLFRACFKENPKRLFDQIRCYFQTPCPAP